MSQHDTETETDVLHHALLDLFKAMGIVTLVGWLQRLIQATQLFLWQFAWNRLLSLNLLHIRFGQWVERGYLRTALPKVLAFEIEVLPVVGVDVPLDELVEMGPEPPTMRSVRASTVEEFAAVFPEAPEESREFVRQLTGRIGATMFFERLECRICHKPVDGSGLCEGCAFAELAGRVGA